MRPALKHIAHFRHSIHHTIHHILIVVSRIPKIPIFRAEPCDEVMKSPRIVAIGAVSGIGTVSATWTVAVGVSSTDAPRFSTCRLAQPFGNPGHRPPGLSVISGGSHSNASTYICCARRGAVAGVASGSAGTARLDRRHRQGRVGRGTARPHHRSFESCSHRTHPDGDERCRRAVSHRKPATRHVRGSRPMLDFA